MKTKNMSEKQRLARIADDQDKALYIHREKIKSKKKADKRMNPMIVDKFIPTDRTTP